MSRLEKLEEQSQGLSKVGEGLSISKQIARILAIFKGRKEVFKKMANIENTEAWKSFEGYRSKAEVEEVKRWLLKGGKVRGEILLLSEEGIPIKRLFAKEPLALYSIEDKRSSVYDIRELIEKYKEWKTERSKYGQVVVDLNMFEYVEEGTLVGENSLVFS